MESTEISMLAGTGKKHQTLNIYVGGKERTNSSSRCVRLASSSGITPVKPLPLNELSLKMWKLAILINNFHYRFHIYERNRSWLESKFSNLHFCDVANGAILETAVTGDANYRAALLASWISKEICSSVELQLI